MRESAIYQDILEEGREEGRQQGLQQGRQQVLNAIRFELYRVALNCLREDIAVEAIARVTGLQLAVVEALKQVVELENEEDGRKITAAESGDRLL